MPTSDQVHVWWIDLGAATGRAEADLSPDERARAARFHRQSDRIRWTRARVAVRRILAGYLGIPPQDVRFAPQASPEAPPIPPSATAVGEGGWGERAGRAKPALCNDPRLRFNLAHAADRAALAVAWEREVGIDLEPVRADLDLDPLTAAACSPDETAAIAALDPDRRIETFLALWTVKEAYLKAVGVGLFRDPRTLEAGFPPGGRVVIHDAAAGDDPTRWDVRLLDAGPGWVAALAVAGRAPEPIEFAWPAPD